MTHSRFSYATTVFAVCLAAMAATGRSQSLTAADVPDETGGSRNSKLAKIRQIVVIYQENHSFDNLYGGWEGVNGRANVDSAHTTQVSQAAHV